MIDISVRNLTKFFVIGENLLEDLSFEVQEGECVAIRGRNGCGKTTLLKILTGEMDYDEGEVFVNPNKRLGLISQIPRFPDGYTVEDVLRSAFRDLIAAKKMGSGNLFFYLVGKDEHPQRTESLPLIAETAEPEITCNEQFVPVSEEEPFEQLDLLEDAHMEIREGETGIVLPMQKNAPPADDADGADDQKSSSSPTGQWSEPNTSL